MGSSVDDRPPIEAVDERVLTLTLNRPEQRNALDTDLRDALAGALDRSHPLSELMDAVERLEKPVVAAIDGVATGAGLTLALACDWRVASTRARLLFREGRLNLVPTHGGVTRMLRRAPLSFGAAKRLLQVAADSDAHSITAR